MRKIRGAKGLKDYLKSIGCPMSESTIYRLMREKKIPFSRPSRWILIFDLDKIDEWLGKPAGEEIG